jgi:di/tricarboxylate transporter
LPKVYVNSHLIITFAILVVAIILFLRERLSPDLVALMVVAALGLSGVLTSQEAFSGFNRSAIIIIASILILAEGVERTGVSEQVGNWLQRVARGSEARLIVTTMVASAFLSLFMNNIAAASVLLPAVVSAGRKSGVDRSRLLMPLAFGTLLGGMATFLTTTNIVTSTLLRDQGLTGFGMLDFAGVGFPLAVAGIVYMAVWGRRMLPRAASQSPDTGAQRPGDVAEAYGLEGYLFRALVPAGSPLIGKRMGESGFLETYGVLVVGLERDGEMTVSPALDTKFRENDVLVLAGEMEELLIRDAGQHLEVQPLSKWQRQDIESETVGLAEVMLSPRSRLIGQTLRSAHFREKYGMTVLAIWGAKGPAYVGLQNLPLEFGDALLLLGPRSRLAMLRADPDLILLTGEQPPASVRGKGWLALSIFAGSLALATWGPWPVAEVMMGGALLMVLVRVLTMEQAYQAIQWRLVFLVAGMLPLGIAMTKTGAAGVLADWMVRSLGGAGPVVMLAGLIVLTVALSQAVKGAAVASVMVPIAVQSAHQIGAEPRSLAMGVALATSMAFITPLGHPVNILVMGEGGYQFRDFLKVGLPLTLLLLVVVLLVLPVFWPLVPR